MKSINNIIEKRAVKTYQVHDFVHEYGVFIAIVIIVKIATSVFNAYAGYYLFNNYFISEFNNIFWSVAFAILALVLLEFLVNYSLTKFFKASLRGNIKGAIGLGLLSLVWFGGSFLVSTNGLAQRHAQKADNSQIIIDKANLEISEARKNAELTINQALNAIETIKANPSGWRGGKRDVLQPEQLKQIEGFYKEIALTNHNLRTDLDLIESRKQMELSENSGNVLVVEKKYYKTAIGIMVLQLFVNGLIMFFYSRIYGTTRRPQLAIETINMLYQNLDDETDKMIVSNILTKQNNYLHALSLQQKNDIRVHQENEQKNKDKKIGFKSEPDDRLNNNRMKTDDKHNNGTVITDDKKTDKPVKNTLSVLPCKYCGKDFQQRIYTHLFCCDDHRQKWHRENKGFDLDLYKKRKK